MLSWCLYILRYTEVAYLRVMINNRTSQCLHGCDCSRRLITSTSFLNLIILNDSLHLRQNTEHRTSAKTTSESLGRRTWRCVYNKKALWSSVRTFPSSVIDSAGGSGSGSAWIQSLIVVCGVCWLLGVSFYLFSRSTHTRGFRAMPRSEPSVILMCTLTAHVRVSSICSCNQYTFV